MALLFVKLRAGRRRGKCGCRRIWPPPARRTCEEACARPGRDRLEHQLDLNHRQQAIEQGEPDHCYDDLARCQARRAEEGRQNAVDDPRLASISASNQPTSIAIQGKGIASTAARRNHLGGLRFRLMK